jgi:hypothetical protein
MRHQKQFNNKVKVVRHLIMSQFETLRLGYNMLPHATIIASGPILNGSTTQVRSK